MKNIQQFGIEVTNESNIKVSQNERGQIDELINQLKNDDILTLKDVFFDLNRLVKKDRIMLKETSHDFAIKISKIKISEQDRFSEVTLSIFREINLMSSFNHPAILKFIGYSPTNFEGDFFPTIIMELCVNKSLIDVIQLEHEGSSLKGWNDTKKLINVYGIASGMKYLHQQGILHRDLKSLNILMDEFLCPKIADFGMSKLTNISMKQSMNIQSTLQRKGTPAYMAPEIWSNIEYSNKGDVYAFSFILYATMCYNN